MRPCLCLWIIIFVCLAFNESAWTEARFMKMEELVAKSDVIAVIEVIGSEKIGDPFEENLPRKGYWTYAQKKHVQIS